METYHLYTLSLLAEIIDDVEKAKDLYEALPTLSKDVLGGLISDELLRGVKKGDKTISMVYPTSETDDQGLGWEQWPLLVRRVENAMKKNGTPANGTTVDISNQTIGSDRSHIKFRAYKGFTMAHIDLVKEEEKWVQQISHSVFAAAGQKGEGGHQDSWNQTYTVESKKELSDLKAKIDDLQKEIKDKEATIKGILDDQQAKLQIQRELDAENESYEEQLRDKERKLTMKNMEDKKQKEKDLAEDLYKKGEEVQALQRKLNETEKQRQVCHKQVGDLEEKHSAVLKEIGEKRKEIDKMTSQSEVNIKGYQEQLSNKDKEINNFLKQVTELEGKMKQLEAELLNSGEANSKRFNKLQTEFITVDKERLKLLADQEELVKENNILQNSVKTAKKEDEDKERDHVEIEQKLKAQLSSVLNEIKSPKDINSGMEHVLDISTAVNEVLRYLKKSSNETKELREKLAKAEERCLIDGREIEDKDSKFSKDLEDVNKKVSELEEQLNNAQSQCQIEVSEKIKFEQELGTTKQALAEKRDLEDQISQRQAEEVKLKEQNESLKNKINRLEGEVTTLKKEYGQVQSSGCQLQKKLNEVEKDREKEKDKAASKDVQIADKDRVVQELQNKLHETRKKLQDEEAKSQAEAKSYSEQLKMGEDEQEVLEKQITSLTAEVHRLTKELTEARAQASQHQTSEKTPRRPLNLQTRGISQSTNVERATDPKATSQGSRSHMKAPSSCDTAIRFSPGSKDKVRAIHRKARQIL
ncbi:Laminin subunit alpha-3 [Fusarium oxysporum f. sp. raphani]|uniref:Laminin subunit alpha-3 n=1 Tax=Fusarium oxysporum f. sp. raphani TaxID=96318 RepID=A0A8J5UIL2_FUSOX|nr:Laminin subunit alpha-3 [Fusarium oxysporum f. sp. raphani]